MVTSKDRFDAEGKPVSLCYGFVEYLKHEDALQALRIINNNPDIFGREKRCAGEFVSIPLLRLAETPLSSCLSLDPL